MTISGIKYFRIKETLKNYSLVSNLTGVKKENPLPECVSDVVLAEHFAVFFTEKISKIRNDLNKYKLYDPPTSMIHAPLGILLLTDETKTYSQIVRELKNKSCELDYSPTSFIKEHTDHLAKTIMQIINLSLLECYFSKKKWKTAILRPLLKK